jgi:acyl carrier protein
MHIRPCRTKHTRKAQRAAQAYMQPFGRNEKEKRQGIHADFQCSTQQFLLNIAFPGCLPHNSTESTQTNAPRHTAQPSINFNFAPKNTTTTNIKNTQRMNRRTFISETLTLILSSMIASCSSIMGAKNALNKKQIKNKIFHEFVRDQPKYKGYTNFDPKTFGWDKHFIRELGFDSLDTVEFIIELEKMFGISIKDEDAEKISTPNQAVEMVYKYLNKGN